MKAGFGSAVITPETPVMLAGFGDRTEPAFEVHDDLEVRVLYLAGDRSQASVCLVVCDLLGMSHSFAAPVREAVSAALGLPLGAVLTACTHTHSGPSCIAGSEAIGWPTPPGYRELLVARCVEAGLAAVKAARTASLAYRRARLPDGLSVNRRQLPYAPWLAMLDVVAEGGERLGVLANLAIHPVALGPESYAVSADWVGPFRDGLEAAAGGRAVMLSGAIGDVNPRHVHRQLNSCAADPFAEAAELGGELAEVVVSEIGDAFPLQDLVELVRDEQLSAPVGETLLSAMSSSSSMLVDLVEWSLGGARLISLPGEAFHAFGRAVEESRGGPVLLAGLSPVWLGYLPVPFTEGYEESMSQGAVFVDAVLDAVRGL